MITADTVRDHLLEFAGIRLTREEAADLVPLVVAQRAALARLERFDVADVRGPVGYDPRLPYARE